MRPFRSFQNIDTTSISEEALDVAIEAAEAILSEMRALNDPVPEACGNYLMVHRLIDDKDLEPITYAQQFKRIRRTRNRLFIEWLREYRTAVRDLHRERITSLAYAGKWDEIPPVLRRYLAYLLLCLRLRIAGFFRSIGVGDPAHMVLSCISGLRRLDRCPVVEIHNSAAPAE